ncbi:SIR2 family protein [Pedobacter sp. V48]|uniref:SIR2 family NAD-dependent protein deacylase n=1 Tax=Pedobacter sp. V48 TaxID=509635 RepID=UPI0003E4E921|nr:SIR2 family protein [Pedobacter sp. V48]ETZ20196.1 hypothetical protein N824_08260 [Pedobacter sp. V48]
MGITLLIEKIRKEEVALFVGSGLSLYGGYKGAKELKELICRRVETYCETETEISAAREKNLEEITELLIRYSGSREVLNKILIQEYKKKPLATHLHDRLGRIPHFDHIFTTNYDTMLEDSMERRCHVIGCTDHFPIQNLRFPKVYKLHGDVNNLDEIIITKRDYAKSSGEQKGHIVWNRFKDVIATKAILFLGHSFEDSNIWEVYSDVEKQFKEHHFGKYMVCPNLNKHQQNYVQSIGFVYINMTGEAFFDHLLPQLIEHAIGDCEAQELSLSTFKRFLDFNDKNVIIKTDDQKIRVEAILELDGSFHSEVNFTLPASVHDQLMKFSQGGIRVKSFKVAQEDILSFSMHMSGFKLPLDASKMETLEVLQVPDEMVLDIESEDGLIEHNKLNLKRYYYQDGANLEFNIHNAGFVLSFKTAKKGINVTFKFDLPAHFHSVKEAIDVLKFITYLFSGKRLDFYLDKQSPFPIENSKPLRIKFDVWESNQVVQHLEQLRFLEKKLKIKFSKIALEQMTPKTVEEVNFLHRIFSDGYVEQDFSKAIILPAELRKYTTSDDGPDKHPDKNLVIEVPKIYTFYDQPLPELFPKFEVIDGEFVRHGSIFAIKSNAGKIRHKLLLTSEYLQLQQGKNELVSVEKFVKES